MKTQRFVYRLRETDWSSPIVLRACICHRPPPLHESSLEYFFLLRPSSPTSQFLPKAYWPSPPEYTRDVPLPDTALCPHIPNRGMNLLLEGTK